MKMHVNISNYQSMVKSQIMGAIMLGRRGGMSKSSKSPKVPD